MFSIIYTVLTDFGQFLYCLQKYLVKVLVKVLRGEYHELIPIQAVLLATKDLRDAANNPITVSTVAWDSTRGVLWGAFGNNVYTINLGDPTVNGVALTTFQFNPNVGGISAIDGLAYDVERDTLWQSPDVNASVFEFGLGPPSANALGVLLSTVTPVNAAGQPDGLVSGVVVGSNNTLYIGRNGAQEIRRVNKSTGAYISQFAQTFGRAEDLSCDPVTYAPLEVIISKELTGVGTYEAFEVETGTCPLPGAGECAPLTQGYWHRQCLGMDVADGGIDPGRNGRGPTQVFEPDFADLLTPVEDILASTIGTFGPACAEGMDADPPRDKCEKAIKQYTALLFNAESDRLVCGVIDVSSEGCSSTTVGDLINEIGALINAGECKVASDCAAFANEGF